MKEHDLSPASLTVVARAQVLCKWEAEPNRPLPHVLGSSGTTLMCTWPPKHVMLHPYTHPSSTLLPGQELRMGLEENHLRSGFTLRSETQFNRDNFRTATVWGSWTWYRHQRTELCPLKKPRGTTYKEAARGQATHKPGRGVRKKPPWWHLYLRLLASGIVKKSISVAPATQSGVLCHSSHGKLTQTLTDTTHLPEDCRLPQSGCHGSHGSEPCVDLTQHGHVIHSSHYYNSSKGALNKEN